MIAKVDHSAGATSVGMTLRPTMVLIFGNPKGSTPMMQVQPTLAIDLPLKALVWTADDGKVKVAVNASGIKFIYVRHYNNVRLLTGQVENPRLSPKSATQKAPCRAP